MRLTLVNQFYAPDISPTAQLAASLAEHRAEQGDRVTVVTGRAGYLEGLAPAGGVQTGPELRIRRVWTPDLGKSSRIATPARLRDLLARQRVRELLRLPRQDVVVVMTTPPFVVVAAVLHQLLHRRTRVVLWSMDCYPDAAERFGELQPGGLASRVLRAINRWAFRRVEVVVGLDAAMVDLLSLPVRRRSGPAALRGDPQLGAPVPVPRRRRRPRRGPATTTSPSAIARSCSTSATPASATGSTPCWRAAERLTDEAAVPLRRRRGSGGPTLQADVRGAPAHQRRVPRLRAQGRDARR